MEKEIIAIILPKLQYIGLRQDKENPDILVMIDFYAGTEKEYVAPEQHITTRYKTEYNVWTQRHETRQYIGSYNTGGYNVIHYLINLKMVFLDTHKVKQGVKLPPIVWQAEYNKSYKNPIEIKSIAGFVYDNMLLNYLVKKEGVTSHSYYYTGIFYDSDYKKVVFVMPDSPAEKAGIKVGDIVKKINKTKIKSYQDLINSYISINSCSYQYGENRNGYVEKFYVLRNGEKMIFEVVKQKQIKWHFR